MEAERRNRMAVGVGSCLLLFSICLAAQQQRPLIPDKYTNLKLLPADIAKPQLLKTMKGFAIDLGVRCSYCHDATDDLTQADFPSDIKATKISARLMMQMTKAANEIIQKMPQPAAPVSCGTCHRGQPKLPAEPPPGNPPGTGTTPHP